MPVACIPNTWAVYRHDEAGRTRVAPHAWIGPLDRRDRAAPATWSLATEDHRSPAHDRHQVTPDMALESTHGFHVAGVPGVADGAARIECVAVCETLESLSRAPGTAADKDSVDDNGVGDGPGTGNGDRTGNGTDSHGHEHGDTRDEADGDGHPGPPPSPRDVPGGLFPPRARSDP